ncbi:hypothetical protein SAMN05518672_11472 [Chitinophaga sp. CF118]|uniref:hypothetical protein n=1 Tax=Chitinophaga sp. CF118 TaxID=1884367 RepID=UPI0008F150EB|nr:hypothetical protein [Chitinophaga sp. CF118]SFF01867.1 hypothetical protein SAMN05518672_11472 [Chitinophaga sp. CF118]
MKLEKASWLVQEFENCTFPKEEWTHVSHFIMAFWYCVKFPLPQAIQKIRSGIMKYNVSIGGKNTDISGYHETITLFYTTEVANYLVTADLTTLTDETIMVFLQQPFLVKDYILKFYSRELLMSKEARQNWVSPDKMGMHTI